MHAFLLFWAWGTPYRTFEPVILNGADLPAILGVSIDELYVVAYRNGTFEPVAFQFDERVGGSYFDPDDGIWDSDDELVVLPGWGGAEAPPYLWSDVFADPSVSRIEIRVTDSAAGEARYLYVFDSASADLTGWPDTIAYDDLSDAVQSDHYLCGFEPLHGLWDELRFWGGSTYGPDILDREKTRASGVFPFPPLPFTVNEEAFMPTGPVVALDGRVRVIRRLEGVISIIGVDIDTVNERQFFPAAAGIRDASLEITAESGIQSTRASLDFNLDATGALVSDVNNLDLMVDGVPDMPTTPLTPMQQQSYFLSMRWNGHALLQLARVAGVAANVDLYYYDNGNGGSGDGTADTGDGVSYGDSGLWLSGIQAGIHQVTNLIIFDSGAAISESDALLYLDQPLDVQTQNQLLIDGLGLSWRDWRLDPNPYGSAVVDVILMADLVNRLQP